MRRSGTPPLRERRAASGKGSEPNANRRAPARVPPAAPPPPPPPPAAAAGGGGAGSREASVTMKHQLAGISRGAMMKDIRRSGVEKLRHTLALGPFVEGQTSERVWPRNWYPHNRAPIRPGQGAINCVHTFGNDSRVLSAGKDGTLRMIDLSTGLSLGRPLEGHDGAVLGCCVLADGRRALSCGEDHTLKVWRLMNAEEDQRGWEDCHVEKVNATCVFQDSGKELALSASDDKTLKVWDLGEDQGEGPFKCIKTLRGSKGSVLTCCVYKAAGGGWEALSGGADNQVRRWRLTQDDNFGQEQTHSPDSQPWLPKQDTLKGRTGHDGLVLDCCVTQDGTRALTGSGDRRAIFWDLVTGTAVRVLVHHSNVYSCCFLPGEKQAMTTSAHAPRLWDIHSGECLRVFAGHTGDVLNCVATKSNKVLTCGQGGSIRVWDLSAHDNVATLGSTQAGHMQHSSVVKEIVVFPDGSKAVTCSYDTSAKVWCLHTGRCLATLREHGSNVNECCIFPDERKILTGSKDGTIKIWDWLKTHHDDTHGRLAECQLTLGVDQHTGENREVRGCGVFDSGQKVFSCSKDTTICIFQLKLEEGDSGHPSRAVSGECIRVLKGHEGLVDRCCVFAEGTRMVSASWDKTCKIWDLGSGECLHTCKDDNKVRGVAVYDDDKKVVCCGSGKWLTMWDVQTGERIKQIDMQHTGTVWGLHLLPNPVPVQRGRDWITARVVVTYSGDGFVKMWHLAPGQEGEIVHARRACNPKPMCVATVPPSFDLGNMPILIGGFASVTMLDVSLLGTGPSAGAIWSGRSCTEPGSWSDWVMDTIKEDSAHFLYFADRQASHPTLIHKLSQDPVGFTVMHKVVQSFSKERADIEQGRAYTKDDHEKALGTIGMISRASNSNAGSALAVAIASANEDMAQLLLEDYRVHIASYAFSGPGYAPVTMLFELTEQAIVDLFGTFPVLAADFLQKLPLQVTGLVSPDAKCDFAGATNDRFLEASLHQSPPRVARDDGSFAYYWDDFIDRVWLRSSLKADEPLIEELPNLDTYSKRMEDTAWGVKLRAERVPLIAGGFRTPGQNGRRSAQDLTAESKADKESQRESIADGESERDPLATGGTLSLYELAASTSSSRLDLYGEKVNMDLSGETKPPFSRLLNQACEFADKTDATIFDSEILKSIVQYKWQHRAGRMYYTLVKFYMLHIISFTIMTLTFENWADCYQPRLNRNETSHGCNVYTLEDDGTWKSNGSWLAWYILGWILGTYAFLYNCLLFKHEVHQVCANGPLSYVKDFWNVIDLLSSVLSFMSMVITLVYWMTTETDYERLRTLDVIQAHALLIGWLKVLYFLRGLDTTSFIVNMLLKIGRDMISFLIVLFVVLVAFATAFHLMLRHDLETPDRPNGDLEEMMFDRVLTSFFGVLGMMFGSFEFTEFREAVSDSHWGEIDPEKGEGASWISMIDLTIFLMVVPLVMLNALIAVMSDTYDRVKEGAEASKRHDRAVIILEMEELMRFEKAEDSSEKAAQTELPTTFRERIAFAWATVVSAEMQYSYYPVHLHQLSMLKTHRGKSDDVAEQVKMLSTSLSLLSETFDFETKRSRNDLQEVLGSIKRLESGMEEQFAILRASTSPSHSEPEPEPEPK